MFAGFFICILPINSLYLPHSTQSMQDNLTPKHLHSQVPILAMDRVYKILAHYNEQGSEYSNLTKIQYMDLAMEAMHAAYFSYQHGLDDINHETKFSNIIHAAVHLLMAANLHEYENVALPYIEKKK